MRLSRGTSSLASRLTTVSLDIYTTLTLKIKGNHGCIYLIYPVIMATGVRYIPSSWQWDIFPSSWQRGSHMSHCCGNIPGYISGSFHFWSIACMTSCLYFIQFNKCICNLTSGYSFNCRLKIFFDLSGVVYTQVVYIT